MADADVFFHKAAIHGSTGNVIDEYATIFDRDNYSRAVRDEFERANDRKRVEGLIARELAKVDWTTRFIYEGFARIGEYSFDDRGDEELTSQKRFVPSFVVLDTWSRVRRAADFWCDGDRIRMCTFKMSASGEELDAWQVCRRVLEPLLFDPS